MLKSSRFYGKEHEHDLSKAYAYIAHYRLRTDKRLHPLFTDLTTCLLDRDFDATQEDIEAAIVCELPHVRKSVKILLSEYAEYYNLNIPFYVNLLNTNKEEHLRDKYLATLKKLAITQDDMLFGDDDDHVSMPLEPFVRGG